MQKLLTLALTVLLLGCAGNAPLNADNGFDAASPGTALSSEKFRYDGSRRKYLIYVPSTYTGNKAVPLLLVFHGGGSNAETTIKYTRLNSFAEKKGFIAVYPEGTGRFGFNTWNAGICCGKAKSKNVDDVGFVREVLNRVERSYNIDKGHVYATGISNGAMMTYTLSCEMSDRLAAIAPISGTLMTRGLQCRPSKPVPVIHFHGTADQNVPIAGGRGEDSKQPVAHTSLERTMEIMRGIRGCNPQATTRRVGDTTIYRYECQHGGPVVVNIIDGGGHNWPGVPLLSRMKRKGQYTSQSINANEEMWSFFQKVTP